MDPLRHDVRLALRRLRARPTSTLAIVAVLALGIGATLVVATVVDTVLLRPLDYPQARRLVAIEEDGPTEGDAGTSYPTFLDLSAATGSHLAAVGAYAFSSPYLSGGDEPEQLRVARVSNGFFDVFGLMPERGRWLDPAENEARSAPVVVISHGLWQRLFGGRDEALGTVVGLDGTPHEIVGVAPERFAFPTWADAWVPLGDLADQARSERSLEVVGRLDDASSRAALGSVLGTLGDRLRTTFPEDFEQRTLAARPLLDLFVATSRPALITLLAAVLGLLLIVSLNVATLEAAATLERGREIAVRIALGAGRGRVLRQLLTESLLIAFLGGIAGLLAATWGIDAAIALGPRDLPRLEQAHIDLRLAALAVLLTTACGLVSGLLPALRAMRATAAGELAGARTATAARGQRAARGMLVSAQVAITVALLVAAGLTARSLHGLLGADLGLDVDRIATIGFVLPPNQFPEPTDRDRWLGQVFAGLEALPGVESTSTVNITPFDTYDTGRAVRTPGLADPDADAEPLVARELVVSPTYFRTAGIPLLAGRDFGLDDGPEAPDVVIVSRTLAERLWGAAEHGGAEHGGATDVVGRTLLLDRGEQPPIEATVVGLVREVRHGGLTAPRGLQLYRPYRQAGWRYANLVLRARAGIEPASLLTGAQRTVWRIDPGRPLFAQSTLGGTRDLLLAQPRFRTLVLGFFSTFALLLAGFGIYSVLAVTVRHRHREIGIRLALGAARRAVRRLVLRQGLQLVAVGLLIGVPLSAAVARLLASQLHGIPAHDPLTAGAVVMAVIATASLAVLAPALRAARVDPVVALREE